MLKLKNKLITVLAIVACTLLVCSAMMFKAPVKAGASQPTLNGSTAIEESYVVGEKFIATGFNINVEGSDYVVDVVYVYTPDGMLYQVTDGYVFRQVGYHKLVFGATVAGQQVMVEESVLVDNTGYSATDLTKVEYIDELSVVADNQKKGLKVTIPFSTGTAPFRYLGAFLSSFTFWAIAITGIKSSNIRIIFFIISLLIF